MQSGRVTVHAVCVPSDLTTRIAAVAQQCGFAVEQHSGWDRLFACSETREPGCVVAELSAAEATSAVPYLAKVVEQLNFAAVLLLNRPSTRVVVSYLKLGVTEIIDWPLDSARLEPAIVDACRTASALQFTMRNMYLAKQRVEQLRRDERAVLDLMLQGKLNKNIASSLGIALRTVEARRKRIFTKLGTRSLAEIAILLSDADHDRLRRPHFMNPQIVEARPFSIGHRDA